MAGSGGLFEASGGSIAGKLQSPHRVRAILSRQRAAAVGGSFGAGAAGDPTGWRAGGRIRDAGRGGSGAWRVGSVGRAPGGRRGGGSGRSGSVFPGRGKAAWARSAPGGT